ncbi:Carboxylesterase [Multifurca ochricompacta]|uniref:Carboxylic ester hydrolase n=1 Tax=Multifurca ochricompacta TaxID=376703 RepID=A0AAD4QN67_9AGAM|nr:Carboxylesterase [Multifurca ochricompacta]
MRFIAVIPFLIAHALSQTITINTTSGQLTGTQDDGVASFKGIRFAHSPIGNLRWEPPVTFLSSDIQNATSLGPSCVQQFPFQGQALIEQLYNPHAPPEDEDCLFLNVWAPAPMSGPLKPVIVWFYGGGFVFGTASLPTYDGASFAKNQDIIFVSLNYRTNVFGFPTAPDLPASGNNLGFLDQELALAWVQDNIAKFGGDKNQVTIMGHSAGSGSVSLAITRRNSSATRPFRAGIMLSGVQVSTSPHLNFSNFNALATALGCMQPPGPQRLQCLRNVPASTIRSYTNGPNSGGFTPGVDNVTTFGDPLQRIRTGQIAPIPILIGSMEGDGTVSALNGPQNLSAFIAEQLGPVGGLLLPPAVRALYPGLSDPQVIAAVERDVGPVGAFFSRPTLRREKRERIMIVHSKSPAKLWSDAFVSSGIKSVYRYTYGAVFADMQPFPNAGAWHGSELPILFGTFNQSTATSAEAQLSQNLQTAFANFAKNPEDAPPVANWHAYEPGLLGVALIPTLAKIAYHGNVDPDNFIELVDPLSTDGPCIVWDPFLDFRE